MSSADTRVPFLCWGFLLNNKRRVLLIVKVAGERRLIGIWNLKLKAWSSL